MKEERTKRSGRVRGALLIKKDFNPLQGSGKEDRGHNNRKQWTLTSVEFHDRLSVDLIGGKRDQNLPFLFGEKGREGTGR